MNPCLVGVANVGEVVGVQIAIDFNQRTAFDTEICPPSASRVQRYACICALPQSCSTARKSSRISSTFDIDHASLWPCCDPESAAVAVVSVSRPKSATGRAAHAKRMAHIIVAGRERPGSVSIS